MAYTRLLKNLNYSWEDKKINDGDFHVNDLEITEIIKGEKYMVKNIENDTWYINSKIILKDTDLNNIASIAVRFAPVNTELFLQIDTHIAGNIYVGMIMAFNDTSIPINIISGDIGCGISILPLVKDEMHIKNNNDQEYYSYVLTSMRKVLIRGKTANKGLNVNDFINEAIKFYDEYSLNIWLNEMIYILDKCEIQYKDKDPTVYDNLNLKQSNVLRYISKYAQSLGSSGNHFMELSSDDHDYHWLVIHSGSRGLGAKVYDIIETSCKFITNGYGVATGELAIFYARAYDALNKFAKLNRIICGISVLKKLQLNYDADTLTKFMGQSYIFKPAIDKTLNKNSILSLISGLTHNGIKAFVNNKEKKVIYILSKGAVAMTKKASASIVALRACEGCYVWTLVDDSCDWEEEDVLKAFNKKYETVYKCDEIIFSGHGAGRCQASCVTKYATTYSDLVEFFNENKIAGNIAPGILGDNPKIAYNNIETVIKNLPLEIACTKSLLKTHVSYKEGLLFSSKLEKELAVYIKEVWNTIDEHEKLRLDIETCIRGFEPIEYTKYKVEVDYIYKNYAKKY